MVVGSSYTSSTSSHQPTNMAQIRKKVNNLSSGGNDNNNLISAPQKVWKPSVTSTEPLAGVPSMFAHSTTTPVVIKNKMSASTARETATTPVSVPSMFAHCTTTVPVKTKTSTANASTASSSTTTAVPSLFLSCPPKATTTKAVPVTDNVVESSSAPTPSAATAATTTTTTAAVPSLFLSCAPSTTKISVRDSTTGSPVAGRVGIKESRGNVEAIPVPPFFQNIRTTRATSPRRTTSPTRVSNVKATTEPVVVVPTRDEDVRTTRAASPRRPISPTRTTIPKTTTTDPAVMPTMDENIRTSRATSPRRPTVPTRVSITKTTSDPVVTSMDKTIRTRTTSPQRSVSPTRVTYSKATTDPIVTTGVVAATDEIHSRGTSPRRPTSPTQANRMSAAPPTTTVTFPRTTAASTTTTTTSSKPRAVPTTTAPQSSMNHRKEKNKVNKKKSIDHLIPEMYRKKPTGELTKAEREHDQQMRDLWYIIRQEQQSEENAALQAKPIQPVIEHTLAVLKNVTATNRNYNDDDDIDVTPKSPTGNTRRLDRLTSDYFDGVDLPVISLSSSTTPSSSFHNNCGYESDSSSAADDGLFRGW